MSAAEKAPPHEAFAFARVFVAGRFVGAIGLLEPADSPPGELPRLRVRGLALDTGRLSSALGGGTPGVGVEFDVEANAGPDEPTRVHRRCVYLSGDVEVTRAAILLRDGVVEVRGDSGPGPAVPEGPAGPSVPVEGVLLALLKEHAVDLPRQVHERLVLMARNVDFRFAAVARSQQQTLMRLHDMEGRLQALEGAAEPGAAGPPDR